MWLKRWLGLTLVSAALVVGTLGCAQTDADREAERDAQVAENQAHRQAIFGTFTPTPTPTLTPTPTPTATGSAGAAEQEPAGDNIFNNWAASNTNLSLALNDQGQPQVFFVAPNADGAAAMQAQPAAGGNWTTPTPVSPDFLFLYDLTPVPDASGRMCAYWSGQQLTEAGNAMDGLFRNCQQSDGAWTPLAEQAALTAASASFSPARAPDGTLHAAYTTRAGPVRALFYSPINMDASAPLAGTPLSGDLEVLLGRLAIDSAGGFHAAWVESEAGSSAITVQTRYSADGGQTWAAAEERYAGSIDDVDELGLRLVADAVGQVHLAWGADNAIHYARWAAGGWEPTVDLAPPSATARQYGVALAVGPDGAARVAWDEFKGGSAQVLLRVQSAEGVWGEVQTVMPTQGNQLALAVDAAGVTHIVWDGDDGLRYLTLP